MSGVSGTNGPGPPGTMAAAALQQAFTQLPHAITAAMRQNSNPTAAAATAVSMQQPNRSSGIHGENSSNMSGANPNMSGMKHALTPVNPSAAPAIGSDASN